MSLPGNPLLRASLRALLAWCVLAGLGLCFVRGICTPLLPLMEGAIDALQSDFNAYLSVVPAAGGLQIAMSCTMNHDLTLPSGRRIPFLASYDCATTDAMHALVPLLIFLVPLVAWPAGSRREAALRVPVGLVLLPVVVALTTPLLLTGIVAARVHPAAFAAGSQLAALLQPFVFMEMGGSWLVPLLAAVLCIRGAASLARRR